jgi:hypothetical protein
MKSHKIQRLKFILNKIEGGDSKREVMCIHFGHPMKKNELVWGSPWEGSHGRSWRSMADHGELAGGEGERGHSCGVAMEWGRAAGGGAMGARPCCSVWPPVLYTWEKAGRRSEEREEKQEENEKKKKWEKIVNMEISRKNKR